MSTKIVIMDSKNIEFVKIDNGIPITRADNSPIRFDISFGDFNKNLIRYRLEDHRDGTFSAWVNNKVIMAGTREECVQALRKRGIQIE